MQPLRVAPLLCALLLGACGVPGASERATDAARELNLAARFGRMDVAMASTSAAARKNFMAHRSEWGKRIRILDVELVGLNMPDGQHAEVQVDYSWTLLDDGVLHTTRITQSWEDARDGWVLVRERRLGGDLGLFNEPIQFAEAQTHPDVQFETKVIR